MAQDQVVDQLLNELKQRQAANLKLLRRLVEAETPSSAPEAQKPVFGLLSEVLDGLDFAVEQIPGTVSGGQLMAWPKGERHPDSAENTRPLQLLIGHCDTVWPVGTLERMPFRVNGNQISGPGVYDMKGGLVQMLMALGALRALSWPMAVMPVVFINSDEETGSRESKPRIGTLAQKANRAYILEPSLSVAGKLKTRRKGVGRYYFQIQGRAAHAGLDPEKGVSAVIELSYLIQKLNRLNDPANGVNVNVGVVEGGVRPNVIAPTSRAEVDVRAPTMEAAEKIEEAVQQIRPELDGITIEVRGGFNRLPLEKTESNERLWRLAQKEGRRLGLDLEEGMAGGGSDGNITSLYTATLDGLGAVGDGAHADHEFLFIDKMIERSALLALLLLAEPLD